MAAEEILRFALFKEVLKPTRKSNKKRKVDGVPVASDSDSSDDDGDAPVGGDDDEHVEKRMDMPASSTRGSASPVKKSTKGGKGKGRAPRSRGASAEEADEDEEMMPVAADEEEEEEEQEEVPEEPSQGSQGVVAPERFVQSFSFPSPSCCTDLPPTRLALASPSSEPV